MDVDELFAELRLLLERHAATLVVACDEPGDYQLDTTRIGPSGTALRFGAVETRGEHVRLTFMPIVSHANLFAGVSDELRAVMPVRSCFDLTPHNASSELIEELSKLVQRGFERYSLDGMTRPG